MLPDVFEFQQTPMAPFRAKKNLSPPTGGRLCEKWATEGTSGV